MIATISDEAVEAAIAESVRWDEGFTSKGPRYFVHRLREGTDDEYDTVSEHPDRASMEAALLAARTRAALEAALPHITQHGIGVKGLKWRSLPPPLEDVLAAETPFGRYSVWGSHPFFFYAFPAMEAKGRHFKTLDAAKAAAQADYENRVKSALQRNPEGAKKSVTVSLTDIEVAALEELSRKQDLSPQRVMIQGLRHYQLLVNGEPDLGPMLDPALLDQRNPEGAVEPVAWRYRYLREDGSPADGGVWNYSSIETISASSLASVQPLYLHPPRSTAEARAMERVAAWHDAQAIKSEARMNSYGPENDPEGIRHRMAGTELSTHCHSAAALRALSTNEVGK